MPPLDPLPSSLVRENSYFQNNSCIFRLFPHLRNFSDYRQGIYSVVQRAQDVKIWGKRSKPASCRFCGKADVAQGVYDASWKQALRSGDKKPCLHSLSVCRKEQRLGAEEGRVSTEVLLGLTARCSSQAFTLKRISVHIAFPCVIIGSWSSPLPSQQSSSTHLKAQEKWCQIPYCFSTGELFRTSSELWCSEQ